MKRVSEIITTNEIKKWKDNDIITITAGTGVGKSYFIKNILYAFAKVENKKILMLIHRINCVNQFIDEIKKDNKNDIIDIITYQTLETYNSYDLEKYKYIVCDEFHYFMGDAGFNKNTDISLNKILYKCGAVKIFMSATGDLVKRYINNAKDINTIDYKIDSDFKYINSLTFFNKDITMYKFIEECIENNYKAIFFIQSAKKAYELWQTCKDKALFNCSKGNKEYYKYVDKAKIQNMLKNQSFNENILITTTCMDAGVNIVDTNLHHVVCDVDDIGVLIQCLGRKRIQSETDKLNVYIKNITNRQLGGKITQLKNKKNKAEFLKSHTVKEYIEKYPRSNDYSNIIYDITVNEDNKCSKQINELMYFKCLTDIEQIETMLNYKKYSYIKYLTYDIFELEGYRMIEEDNNKSKLELYLESIEGQIMLAKKDRKELIETINVKSNGKILKNIDSLNSALKELKIPYVILELPKISKTIDGKTKQYKTPWKVVKL